MSEFKKEVEQRLLANKTDKELLNAASQFMLLSTAPQYSYNFSWMGRPIIQYPQDMVAIQEIIWSVKPDLIIETGIAHGGSLILSASMMALLDISEAIENDLNIKPAASKRKVLGIDIDIRPHNRSAIEEHPMANYIEMIQGSSISKDVINQVQAFTKNYKTIMVFLDSNHTHDHVLSELEAYAPLVSINSYCVVFDTIVEDLPKEKYPNRSWGPGNNPKTAVKEYLSINSSFVIDESVDAKLLISVAPNGYLRRIS